MPRPSTPPSPIHPTSRSRSAHHKVRPSDLAIPSRKLRDAPRPTRSAQASSPMRLGPMGRDRARASTVQAPEARQAPTGRRQARHVQPREQHDATPRVARSQVRTTPQPHPDPHPSPEPEPSPEPHPSPEPVEGRRPLHHPHPEPHSSPEPVEGRRPLRYWAPCKPALPRSADRPAGPRGTPYIASGGAP
jgi:hypothetical protein